jgi:formylglycine-generating enzyme required for sulfatase activity
LAGNVWEWNRNEYGDYPYDPADGRETGDEPGDKYFTFRGGGWNGRPFSLRASFRDNYYGSPDDRYSVIGFRLARHPPV